MTLDIEDKIYIDAVINASMEKNRIQFRNEIEPFFRELQKENQENNERILTESRKESEHIIGSLKEAFKDDVAKVIEIASSRPDRDEVRQIVREEVRPIVRDELNTYAVPCIKEAVEAGIAPLRNDIHDLKDEMVALRKDSNRHDREIKALKLKAA